MKSRSTLSVLTLVALLPVGVGRADEPAALSADLCAVCHGHGTAP